MKTQNFTFKVKKNQLKKSTNFKLKVKFFENHKFHFKSEKNPTISSQTRGKQVENLKIVNSPPQARKFWQPYTSKHIKTVFSESFTLQNPKNISGKSSWNFKSEILKVKFSGGKISL